MARVPLTDDSSKWFDTSKAIRFDEDTRWDGNNHISRATGSQWNHEALYFTKSGNWILNAWSQCRGGSPETYGTIGEESAIAWLISQDYADKAERLEELPEAVRAAVEAGIAAAEL